MTSSTPRLSGVRTFLFVGLAVVWFGEGVLTGVQPLAEAWTRFWKMFPPDNPSLAAALYITHAFEASLKAGLLALALFALLSGKPSVRTPLFVSMSLVPPINIAFHFRAQGFPLVSMTIATTLVQQGGWTCARSTILLPFVLLLVGWVAYAAIGRTRGDL